MANPTIRALAEDGKAYFDPTTVSVDDSKLIAQFKGTIWMDFRWDMVTRSEQERFITDVIFPNAAGAITIENLAFAEAQYPRLLGIAINSSDTLVDGATASTSITITQAIKPVKGQFLFRFTEKPTQKVWEVTANNLVCPVQTISFPKNGVIEIPQLRFYLMGDTSRNVVKINKEN